MLLAREIAFADIGYLRNAMNIEDPFSMTVSGAAIPSFATLDVVDPATEEIVAVAPDATRAQLDQAVESARKAFSKWSGTPIAQRQDFLVRIGQTLVANQEILAQLLTREQGKPLENARKEVARSAYWCAEFAKLDLPVQTLEDTPDMLVQVRRVPIGVVGGIVPWNVPLLLALWKIAPALLAGNTMVLKPSPFTPLATLKLGELLRDVLPPGVLNVISGGDALGPWMSSHPGIDKISFTGSTRTGRRVMESAAINLKRLTLELGGNDAAIVLPGCDVEEIASTLFWGAFINSGQVCVAIKRLYIHEDIYERMAGALARIASQTPMGHGMDAAVKLGPVQNRQQFEHLKGLLAETRAQGCRILAGGEIPAGKGYFFPVTLVDNPPDTARVVQEEPFGPILPLLKFKDVDEAVARANDCEFGLGGSVWGPNEEQALAIACRLHAGTVSVNGTLALSPSRPMAGHKQSGLGVENGIEGLLEYTLAQTISMKPRRA
ncbi:aldehyde dehydrogenase family protein [Achromobacter sp. ACM03]|uniref:aldehyde dehydrogenase family protein n=1 Tax=Achromobacter sp. ACM03 TaxID=2769300 RepID=UPI001CE11A2B|nr:aldehyde dehydrogenase family protein [Achromobacter sp. ACM03]